jgi:hypothetical protein
LRTEELISSICLDFDDFSEPFAKLAKSRLNSFLDGGLEHFAVPSLLRILLARFTEHPDLAWCHSTGLLLFTKDSLPYYVQPLDSVCDACEGASDGQLSFTVLEYLLRHWPEVSSAKQSIFLTELRIRLPVLNDEQVCEIQPIAIARLAAVLNGNTYREAVMALEILSDTKMTDLLGEDVWACVARPVRKLLESCHPEVRNQAAVVARILEGKEHVELEDEGGEREWNEIWREIRELARRDGDG